MSAMKKQKFKDVGTPSRSRVQHLGGPEERVDGRTRLRVIVAFLSDNENRKEFTLLGI